ncbi:threonine-phosphate decarboxylase CobD [Roseivivax isoporae]|uniref:threonine-phosphate decarboxylase n=1 Tax=Roseivivax isoporae LMG 25204 TaxID=1449351 RepID=X7F573_9RHOB|nr:threonine-phosphate decarboxylase CobD [Roseivivax isoporae]ETX28027.1 alpha ribazole-5'-P phosphatase [Roseivivax isoporae LMG 25204]
MRDHGGDLDRAMARHGGDEGAWTDLSTGINPVPYPLPDLPGRAWTALPTAADLQALRDVARAAYATRAAVVPLAGAQAAIQLVPRLDAPRTARVLGPTYNEHAAALAAAGWSVETVGDTDALAGADLAVVVNPNNPDGRRTPPDALRALAARVGQLVVDESFADAEPALSLAPLLDGTDTRVVVLRSFGKFYGLAGLRLGFALAGQETAARLATLAGPWAVSGPAIAAGVRALADSEWQAGTIARLTRDAARLDALAGRAGWRLVGGTHLFRTYDTGDARAAQERLARRRVWSRAFPYSGGWLRLGLPGTEAGWRALAAAL